VPALRCIVLDFDGTFTRVEEEAAPFERAYREALTDLLREDVTSLWNEEVSFVNGRPHEFGWKVDERIVAPCADPYILATAVAHRLFDRLGMLKKTGFRFEVLQALYRDAYRHSATAFRPEAKEALERLLELGHPVYVVTNSNTDVVEKKVRSLAPRGHERIVVRGDAKKFIVEEPQTRDDRFDAVPSQRTLDGLHGRPVYLRRGHYYEVLRRLWSETGTTPAETVVCGDIYELDLALPEALGCHLHLVERHNTLPYEKQAVLRSGRGATSPDLLAMVERVQKSQ
jgi:FMN phosphatase YigB (HAD superfamily)